MLKFSEKNTGKLICNILGLSRVGMDSDQLVCVLLSFFGEEKPVFWLGSKIFPSRTLLLARLQTQTLFPSSIICDNDDLSSLSSRAIELACLCKIA